MFALSRTRGSVLSTVAAIAAIGVAFAVVPAQAQSGSGSAAVTIGDPAASHPLTFTKQLDLSFASLTPTGRGDTFVMDPSNLSYSDPHAIYTSGSPTFGAWNLDGLASAPVQLTLDTNVTLMNGATNGPTVDLTFAVKDTIANTSSATTSGRLTFNLNSAGNAFINVGGTLNVPAGFTPAGTYSAAYNIAAAYQ